VSVAVQFARRTTAIVAPEDRLPFPAWGWPTLAAGGGAVVFCLGLRKHLLTRTAKAADKQQD